MHTPVLLNEALEYLNPRPGQRFIDATIDGGGHAMAIVERLVPGGKLLGVEIDSSLFHELESKIKNYELREKLILVNDSYVNLKKIAEQNNFMGADGVLFDLGLSSWHLESAGRGFTFQRDEPLDMRFNLYRDISNPKFRIPDLTAADIINKWSYDELAKIFKEYGGERFAKSIAARIVKTRKGKPIKTTYELVEVIKNSVPFWYRRGRLHFATRTFQAIRIAVNDELKNIESGLMQAMEILSIGGRLAVISFHSLEDRITKNFFKDRARAGLVRLTTKKPVLPSLAEITENPRARSAKLRVGIKL